MFDFDDIYKLREGNRIEAKKATGGLPQSIWKTYSAFGNSYGGVILLGVDEESNQSLKIIGVDNPEKLVTDFWSVVNNPQKVNYNILFDRHVQIVEVEGKQIIIIEVPRAERTMRPIYLNEKPFAETYRRDGDGDGDFHCNKEMVQAMFRDSGYVSQDLLVLENMTFDVFDYDSVHRYRNVWKLSRFNHVWESLDGISFLQKLNAIGVGADGKLHPTVAGLLMFGYANEIVREFPNYFLDYQENYDFSNRYTDRIYSSSGDWSGNLFDFYYKAYNKLVQNPKIKIPFKMKNGMQRTDDTPVHKALREALANCLINADYYGERGLVIRNKLDTISMENPGLFRISIDEAKSGGVSSPRNSTIMTMFNLLDIGERAGSGVPSVIQAWKEVSNLEPFYSESISAIRTFFYLPLESFNEGDKVTDNSKPTDNTQKTRTKVTERVTDEPKHTENTQKTRTKVTEKQIKIISFIKQNPYTTSNQLSALVGISSVKIRENINKLREKGLIERIGADRGGYWKVKE